mmetsp:Transcript_9397/g.14340  ORF Transcript_9397/g.14340 Transcript_9397/m.14340 type:complete len:125 (+) Transcript_9397:2051-2425(+)
MKDLNNTGHKIEEIESPVKFAQTSGGKKNRSKIHCMEKTATDFKSAVGFPKNFDLDQACAICRDDFELESSTELAMTDCNHLFHRQCFREWMKTKMKGRLHPISGILSVQNPDCPNCRKEITLK